MGDTVTSPDAEIEKEVCDVILGPDGELATDTCC
jgi:hypothetical protein